MDQPFDPNPQPDAEELRLKQLQDLGRVIATKRQEAIQSRKDSGIEDVWKAAEEAYLGIDDANRSMWSKAKWAKPTSMEGPLTSDRGGNRDETKSSAYIRLTSRYVDAGAAKISEIILPVDDKPFSFDPSPVPELVQAQELLKQAATPPAAPTMPQQPMAAAVQGAMSPMQQPMQAPPDPAAAAQQLVDKARKSAKAAEKRVFDWLVEAKFATEMRKVIFDGSRIGTGVLKAPFAVTKQEKAVTRQGETVALEIRNKVSPGVKWIDPWNCYPDGACGEDIHTGDHFFERDFLSARKLQDLKKDKNYLADQIDAVLQEGPGKTFVDENGGVKNNLTEAEKRRRFEVWYYYGLLSREDFAAAKGVGEETLPKEQQDVFVILTLVNERVLRVVINPLDSGRFPYRIFNWSRRAGHWAGVGVAEQADVPQKMCNAATRAMLNNAGRTAGSQIVIDSAVLTPADGSWTITPDKIWYKLPDAVLEDVRKAFMSIELPDRQQSLMNIIEYAFRVAEESTNIPLISQGQSGPSTPDTYGAAQLQNNNANQLLRNVAAACDDTVTEPMINDYYEWLLLDPDVPNDEKGDFQINAHGSTALVERAIQNQIIQQLVEPSVNPAFGLNPASVMTEYLKSQRIDPRSLQYTDEEKQKMASASPPPAPVVQAAQIRAEASLKAKQIDAVVEEHRTKADTDRDTVYVQSEQQKNANDHEARMAEVAVKRELAMLEYANREKVSLESIKAQLAQTVMKINADKDLAVAGHLSDLHKHHNPAPDIPPIEPAGRAPDGEAMSL